MKSFINAHGIRAPAESRNSNEEKLTRLEEARQAEMEVAQEEDEAPQAAAKDEEGIKLNMWGYGLIRYTRGLQL